MLVGVGHRLLARGTDERRSSVRASGAGASWLGGLLCGASGVGGSWLGAGGVSFSFLFLFFSMVARVVGSASGHVASAGRPGASSSAFFNQVIHPTPVSDFRHMLLQVVSSMSPKNLANQILMLELDSDTLIGGHVTLCVGCRPHMKSCAHTNYPIHMIFFFFFVPPCAIF